MIKHLLTRKYAVLATMTIALGFAACKKNKVAPEPEKKKQISVPAIGNSKQTPTTDRVELSNDSVFLYAKEIYYWNASLPTYDEYLPRRFKNLSTDLANYEENLFNIGKISASPDYTPGFTDLNYSFIEDATTVNAPAGLHSTLAAVDTEGNGKDVGLRVERYRTNNTEPAVYSIFVTAVYPGSPAAAAGVQRGWLIKTINGVPVGADITYAKNAVDATSAIITGTIYTGGVKGADFSKTLALTTPSYKSSPVYKAVTLTSGTKKIGYLAFARFSTLDNNTKAELDAAFADFSREGVKDLVIDLRYNGGGYISTAEYLTNLIAPSSANGQIMFTEYYNSTMRNGQAGILINQPVLDVNNKVIYSNALGRNLTFADEGYGPEDKNTKISKKGSLGSVSNIVFIVSSRTASASELVINSLKPYLNVKLVGTTTYGKPVGFFPIRIQKRYDVFFAMFETKNKNGEGGYFKGMPADYDAATDPDVNFIDDPRYEFGDVREGYLAKSVAVLSGTPRASASAAIKTEKTGSVTPLVMAPSKEDPEFVGMIKSRVRN